MATKILTELTPEEIKNISLSDLPPNEIVDVLTNISIPILEKTRKNF